MLDNTRYWGFVNGALCLVESLRGRIPILAFGNFDIASNRLALYNIILIRNDICQVSAHAFFGLRHPLKGSATYQVISSAVRCTSLESTCSKLVISPLGSWILYICCRPSPLKF
jgi:hypothetical protein